MDKDYFIGIYEPVDVRRNLLEASKEIVSSLKSYEKLESIRREKLRHYQEMKDLISELDMLVSRLRKNLPRSDLRKTVERPKMHIPSDTKNSPAEMRKLEEQIRKIEDEFSKIKL
jgi:hypothetical protein